ncbi:PhzF family phenazine biosynthesis protein [Paenibacillus albicereus]|uniref:PhzF family phenazine biosynthesis protein n=1 Tax=Paenibacillus albicereus TaxID=2726185 RepID=A0A6H2GVG5_9BACL|nr:PhzF family phenazine biosynthesis protein [Paenibacillus albicereus]QJC51421.1 PhzF family phenazine biosynthesis protein [Paenibacillus albicereus]
MRAETTILHYDAFAGEPGQGNPGGVVLHAEDLADGQMLELAARVGFNETCFVLPSEQAGFRIRYFTPGHEMDLCGHGTIACLAALETAGRLDGLDRLTIETLAGVLPIRISRDAGSGKASFVMRQASPRFLPFGGSRAELADALGLQEQDLHPDLPIVYGSTGIWTLCVPVRGLDACARMRPDNRRFPELLAELPRASLHPFCLETVHADARLHARHFSSPYSGTIEDPVTGTASGVLGAYWDRFIEAAPPEGLRLTVEQGQEVGRDGKVHVTVVPRGSEREVEISGSAVFVREWTLPI